jgi:hypothetical protein
MESCLFEAESRINDIYKFSPYLKENTTRLHYKKLGNAVREIVTVYAANHKKPLNTLCEYGLLKSVVHIVTTVL